MRLLSKSRYRDPVLPPISSADHSQARAGVATARNATGGGGSIVLADIAALAGLVLLSAGRAIRKRA
jgi:hypothetical protein